MSNGSSQVIQEINQLKKLWRKQDFHYTPEQKERYGVLQQLRWDQIKEWKKEGKVSIGPSNAGKSIEENEKKEQS